MDLGPLASWEEQYLCVEGELPKTSYRVFGASGNTLREFTQQHPLGAAFGDVIAYGPDLIVFSYGINDVRFGHCSTGQLTVLLTRVVDGFASALPNSDIIMRMPNGLLGTGANIGWSEGSTAQKAATAYSDILQHAFENVAKARPDVLSYDTRELFFDKPSIEGRSYMADDIHPSLEFYAAFLEDLTHRLIGRTASAALARK